MSFSHLKTLDLEALELLDADALAMPWDDNPTLDGPEVDVSRVLARDRTHLRRPLVRTCVDFRADPEAYAHLKHLPKRGESLHGVIGGRYALWELVPALMERTGKRIRALYVATLGFSRQNAADLLALLDAKRVASATLMVSHYFKSTSREIYDCLVPPLLKRGHRVLAYRTHCKLILAHMTDGSRFTVESSANLRSCKNVETFVLTHDAKLYEFHRGWIEDVLAGDRRGDADGGAGLVEPAEARTAPRSPIPGFESKLQRAMRKRGRRA